MNYFGMEIVVDNLKIVYIDIFLCFVYCPPKKAAFHSYKKVFEKLLGKIDGFQKPAIKMGDLTLI